MTDASLVATSPAAADDLRQSIVLTYFKQLRLPALARECVPLARAAEQRGLGYLGYLQALLEQEVAQRHEHQLRQRLKAAAFPTDKRLDDFDFSLVPSVPKTRLLELAQGAFLAAHDSVVFLGPSGLGKTHLLLGLGRALCLAGYALPGRVQGALPHCGDPGHGTRSRPQGAAAAAAAGALPPLRSGAGR